jgi:hypothetical protein
MSSAQSLRHGLTASLETQITKFRNPSFGAIGLYSLKLAQTLFLTTSSRLILLFTTGATIIFSKGCVGWHA